MQMPQRAGATNVTNVIGDSGIHQMCGDAFWNNVAAEMRRQFRQNNPTRAIVGAIEKIGQLLGEHFPRSNDDINELPDEIGRG